MPRNILRGRKLYKFGNLCFKVCDVARRMPAVAK
jgi:hypothetical protein